METKLASFPVSFSILFDAFNIKNYTRNCLAVGRGHIIEMLSTAFPSPPLFVVSTPWTRGDGTIPSQKDMANLLQRG